MATTIDEILRPSHPMRALAAQGEKASREQEERAGKRRAALDEAERTSLHVMGEAPGMAGAQERSARNLARTMVETAPAGRRTAAPPAETGGMENRPWMGYEELWDRTHPQPTQEELELERKKQRREQIFAAVGDGISALSNLYFTTQYAPNMYSGSNSASKRARERRERMEARRSEAREAYVQGKMRARQMDEEAQDRAARLNLDLWKAGDASQRGWGELKRKQQKDKEDAELGKASLEERKRHNKAAEDGRRRANAIGAGRLALDRKRFDYQQERDKDEDFHGIAVQRRDGSTAMINVKKRNWTPTNISKLYWLLGGDDDIVVEKDFGGRAKKTRKPTTKEMEQYIGANMELESSDPVKARQVQNALDFLEGLE